MAKSSNKIEIAAVNCITDAFQDSKRLETFIPIGDREPAWDGNIYIMHGNKGYSRIPTQVKGKTVKKLPQKTTYKVNVSNLENYKRDGGLVYFVVYIIGNQRFPYYALLAPLDLKRYIKKAQGCKSIAITLKPLGNVVGDLENQFIQFYYDCKQQTSFADSPVLNVGEAIEKGYSLNYTIHGIENREEAMKYAMSHYIYLYANVGSQGIKTLYPIGDQPYKVTILQTIKKVISCGNKVFFTEYQYGGFEDHWEVIIDGYIRIYSKKESGETKVDINLNPSNIKRYFHQLSFVYELSRSCEFFIEDKSIKLNQILAKERENIERDYCYWSKIIKVLDLMHVDTSRIDMKYLDDIAHTNLNTLEKAILHQEEVSNSQELSHLTTMDLGPYRLLLWTEKASKGKYRVYDFFSWQKQMVFAVENHRNEKMAIPIYSFILQRDDFNKFVNVDYSKFIDSYETTARFNREISAIANNDVLKLISAYDTADIKDNRILETALNLTEWIARLPESGENSYIYQLNRFQIIKRLQGEFNKNELEQLVDLAECNIPDFAKWAANLLLGDYARADYIWGKLSLSIQEELSAYPIYFFQKSRSN